MSLLIPVDETVTMRLLEPQHAEQVFAVFDPDRLHLRRWLNWPDRVNSADDIRHYAGKMLHEYADRRAMVLSILEHGQIVGGTGYNHWVTHDFAENALEGQSADIGYWLVASAQGRGIATRCVRRLVTMAFDEFQMHRLTIRAEPDNERSNAIPKRLGFTLEGALRHVCKYDGRWVNHNLWSLLAEEWTQ